MKKKITVDGNEACAYTSYFFTEVAGIYPITPSSPMAEHIDEWSCNNRKNIFDATVKVVEMQSEAGAAGMVHGSLQAGCLTSTYTASQGLLLMIPNMYKIAGEQLPAVFHVAARSLSTHALSIFGDHQDVYAARATGFALLASSSVQDATYMAGIAHLSALEGKVPFLHFFDGFRTSHELQKIDVLEKEDWASLLNQKAMDEFRLNGMNVQNPDTRGTAQNDDIYFQMTEVRNPYYNHLPEIVSNYMEKVNQLAGTNYHLFDYYGDPEAQFVIVAMGSVTETIKETIDALKGPIGLIEVHLYRPFATSYLKEIMPKTVKRIAVLDRTKEAGSTGEPLYLDVVTTFQDTAIEIVGGRYGLSSKNTNPSQIKAVYEMLKGTLKPNFTIGIEDDVTHLSLQTTPYNISTATEYLIYGYGSDGMVSASKSLMKLIGDNTDSYVQGYFQYDSKKSGGVTLGHLRFAEQPIHSTYYVENPSCIVVTKESYLHAFDCLHLLQENGICIFNTIQSPAEWNQTTPNHVKKILRDKKANVYLINAYELARKVGLKNKISTILESAILSFSHLVDYSVAKEKMKEYAKDRYFKKGEEVLKANYEAIDQATSYLIKIVVDDQETIEKKTINKTIFERMTAREGDQIPVSAFATMPNGHFEAGTSQLEKRGISDIVPRWLSDNCIQCNQCSLVCPHGVIRPYLLNEEEYQNAPVEIQKRVLKPLEKNLSEYYYVIGISVLDCTGCGLCLKTCPGKKQEKALIANTILEETKEKEQQIFAYLEQHVTEKRVYPISTIKGSQMNRPKFCFSGACAGCGETGYLKLLSQLFGSELMIANATGCSSIYGASAPSTPYTVPWASSLFEDNAEYGYGMLIASKVIKERIRHIMEQNMDHPSASLFKKWIEYADDPIITREVYEQLDNVPEELKPMMPHLLAKTVWTVGGDGWAYDIGYGGIDHVLASNDDVNILVLDSEVYSNTGGQSSKASPKGSIAAFTASGKKNCQKDLARMALAYPHVYVAQVNLNSHPAQVIKAFEEAARYHGPSLIIAYSPCISHGIKGGMERSLEIGAMATKCGYFPTFRYDPRTEKLTLDSKQVDFSLYEEFLNHQTRYSMLKVINPEHAQELLEENKKMAMNRYQYYQLLSKEKEEN